MPMVKPFSGILHWLENSQEAKLATQLSYITPDQNIHSIEFSYGQFNQTFRQILNRFIDSFSDKFDTRSFDLEVQSAQIESSDFIRNHDTLIRRVLSQALYLSALICKELREINYTKIPFDRGQRITTELEEVLYLSQNPRDAIFHGKEISLSYLKDFIKVSCLIEDMLITCGLYKLPPELASRSIRLIEFKATRQIVPIYTYPSIASLNIGMRTKAKPG